MIRIRKTTQWVLAAALAIGTPTLVALAQDAAGDQQAQQQQLQQEQEQAVQGALQQQGQTPLSMVESFLGPNTASVLHVNLKQADLARAQEFFSGVIAKSNLPESRKQQMLTQFGGLMAMAQNWGKNLQEAGAEHAFVVTWVQDNKTPTAVIIPTPQGQQVDQQAIQQLLTPPAGQQAAGLTPQTAIIRDAVVLSTSDHIQRLQQQQQQEGVPESLTNAFQAVSDASVHILVLPTKELEQAMLQQGAGRIPFNPAGDIDFTQAVQWMAIGIDYPDQQQVFKTVLKASDAQTAQQLAEQVNQRLEQAQARAEAQAGEQGAQLAAAREALKPTVEQDRVVISLTRSQAADILSQSLQVVPRGTMQQQQPMMPDQQQQQQQDQQGTRQPQ